MAPNVCDECDGAAGCSAEWELADRSVARWRLPGPSHIRRPGQKQGLEDYGALLEENSPLNEVGKDGRLMAYGSAIPGVDVTGRAGIPVHSAGCGVEGSRPRDVRSDNGITGGLRAEKARFDVRRRAPERVRRVGGPDLAVTGGPVLTAHSEGAP